MQIIVVVVALIPDILLVFIVFEMQRFVISCGSIFLITPVEVIDTDALLQNELSV